MYDIVGRPNEAIVEDSIHDVIKDNDIEVIVRYDYSNVKNSKKIIK